jgi:hypothetical protein
MCLVLVYKALQNFTLLAPVVHGLSSSSQKLICTTTGGHGIVLCSKQKSRQQKQLIFRILIITQTFGVLN